ncbi:alanine racemase [Neolewinella litorea]|uniref:D-TA family PLP-dependent enzyme n=1 Tax=Neolewinella litorea TaxID=2562452 RepID=A0A4S4NKC6_9BACT|nr:alanine racemase [Neolewinella litorea]THH40316.1 D-TA family PLP-dependent enzyme [Neolewinella litorea]
MTWKPDYRYAVEGLEDLDSPALLVFPEVIAENIDRALALTATPDGHCLQPHIKTVKCREVAEMARGRGITRFKCSTVSEGELLGEAGAGQVLLSYQLSDVKARRWQELRSMFPATEFSSLVDNEDTARMLSERFADDPLPVYLDLNLGMDRTGVRPAKAMPLLQVVNSLPGLALRGFHVYDGHIRDAEESARRRQAEAVFEEVQRLRASAEAQIGTTLEIVVAGSPNFPFYVGKRNTWVSPGTFFLWDAGYGTSFDEWPFEPAALLLTRVLSIIDERTLCFDLGSKAVAADPPQPRVYFPGIPNYEIRGQWEEHLVITVPDTSRFRVGQPYWAVPRHVCPTVNLYEELLPVTGGKVETGWRVTARDRKITV